MDKILKDRRVLVGVTGSIAIYKSLELIRLLTKSGATVRIVMSENAKKFITPLTFETLSSNIVLHENSESWASDLNHIGLSKWAETFVIAPATANTINKLANGFADNLLLQTALAYNRIIIISPSANTNMINNTITEGSLKLLKLSNFKVLGTQKKELACKTVGDGAMASPEEIFFEVVRDLLSRDFWKNRRVIVTGGGTIEKIDEVRYISNFSSGKMGSALAKALYFRGADVCFISSRFPESLPNESCKIEIQSADELNKYINDSIRIAKKGLIVRPKLGESGKTQLIQKIPYLFMSSAVADYRPKIKHDGKLKSHLIGESWNLELTENLDILENLDKNGIRAIGFKAETDKSRGSEYARAMLEKKDLYGVCLNILENSESFGSDSNQIDLFLRNGTEFKFPKLSKLQLSLDILDYFENIDL
jgi:phosphopantothenoylcysteine decarboxylase/phosphopantothenate--cysteine ligase